jgi:hypothetical protein
MPALVAGIHALIAMLRTKTWMAGTSPAMTKTTAGGAGYHHVKVRPATRMLITEAPSPATAERIKNVD